MGEGVFAVFRPRAQEIAVYLQDRGRTANVTLPVEEARQIHATLGQALRHADSAGEPISAVTDAALWRVRQAVGAIVGGEAGALDPAARFARRIEAGEADGSEPMQIALAAVAASEGGQ